MICRTVPETGSGNAGSTHNNRRLWSEVRTASGISETKLTDFARHGWRLTCLRLLKVSIEPFHYRTYLSCQNVSKDHIEWRTESDIRRLPWDRRRATEPSLKQCKQLRPAIDASLLKGSPQPTRSTRSCTNLARSYLQRMFIHSNSSGGPLHRSAVGTHQQHGVPVPQEARVHILRKEAREDGQRHLGEKATRKKSGSAHVRCNFVQLYRTGVHFITGPESVLRSASLSHYGPVAGDENLHVDECCECRQEARGPSPPGDWDHCSRASEVAKERKFSRLPPATCTHMLAQRDDTSQEACVVTTSRTRSKASFRHSCLR